MFLSKYNDVDDDDDELSVQRIVQFKVRTAVTLVTTWPRRYSTNVETSVNDLIESLQQPLSDSEQEKMLHSETSHRSDTDAYTLLLNYFTQKNTDALVNCTYNFCCGFTCKALESWTLLHTWQSVWLQFCTWTFCTVVCSVVVSYGTAN